MCGANVGFRPGGGAASCMWWLCSWPNSTAPSVGATFGDTGGHTSCTADSMKLAPARSASVPWSISTPMCVSVPPANAPSSPDAQRKDGAWSSNATAAWTPMARKAPSGSENEKMANVRAHSL